MLSRLANCTAFRPEASPCTQRKSINFEHQPLTVKTSQKRHPVNIALKASDQRSPLVDRSPMQ